MTSRTFSEAVANLDYVRKHPFMFIKPDVLAVESFLLGFQVAWAGAYSFRLDFTAIHAQVLRERGWEHRTKPVWQLMQEQGLSTDAIINAMLDIHYET